MSEVETLILRFRDLSTEDGETVSLHNEIARQSPGYFWWGWWRKEGSEQLPFEEFAALRRMARSEGGLVIYLLDSSHSRTYRATCTDIDWEAGGEPKPSPEPDRTPAYYRAKKVLAWFKLGVIEEYALDTRQFSYVRVDKLFLVQPSKYTAFYGKRIFSAQELTQQNRTIWFIREARPTDKEHEVSLLDARSLSPENFPRTFLQSGSRNLLWVSDLHYTFGEHSHHAFALDPRDHTRKTLAHALQAALVQHEVKDIGGVLVSGDITWKASPDEFEQALGFFRWTDSWADLTPYQSVVCPGNHDLAYTCRADEKNAPIERAFSSAKSAYADFYTRLFNIPPNEFLSCGRRYLLGGSYPIEIVSLNSSLLEQRPGVFQGHGFLGDKQLQNAAEAFGWNTQEPDEGRPYRIVMLHHHLVPVTYRERPDPTTLYGVVLDAEALMRWVVQYRVDIVLHGHMHQPSCVRLSKPVELRNEVVGWHDFYVLGMGSTGVTRDHQGSVARNTFGVLCFGRSGVKVSVYSVSDTDPSEPLWSVELPFSYNRGA